VPVVSDSLLFATASLRRAVRAFALALVFAGCATAPMGPRDGAPSRESAPPIPAQVEPPPPAVNLSGFPLTYRQGYADGCASATGAERKDGTRFAADGNYRTGWQDGLALCRKR
jgi:hypothetical protein